MDDNEQSKAQKRLNLVITDKDSDRIDHVQQRMEATTAAETVRRCVRTTQMLLKFIDEGYKLCMVKGEETIALRIVDLEF